MTTQINLWNNMPGQTGAQSIPRVKPNIPGATPNPKTRDEVCSALVTFLNLNRYDNKFIQNITHKYIKRDRGLTAKQSEVFDKIVQKYRKQLKKKLNLDYADVLAMKWSKAIVTLNELQKSSYFKIVDDEMILHFHFNKEVIEEVRSLVHDDQCDFINKDQVIKDFGGGAKYNFIWHNDREEWSGKFNAYLFKSLMAFARKNKIVIDKSVTDLEDKLSKTGTKEMWETHLHESNGVMYISNISETMLNVIEDIDFKDTSLYNVQKIVQKLCIAPPARYGKFKDIMLSKPSGLTLVKTGTVKEQSILKEYINHQDPKKTLFYLPKKKELSEDNYNDMNDFIKAHQMDGWGCDILIYNEERSLGLDQYDTIITPLSIDGLISSNSILGGFALLNVKFIRIN